jgi:hypothetical protein
VDSSTGLEHPTISNNGNTNNNLFIINSLSKYTHHPTNKKTPRMWGYLSQRRFNLIHSINLYQFLIFDIPLSLTIYNYLLPKEIQMSLLIRELDELNL